MSSGSFKKPKRVRKKRPRSLDTEEILSYLEAKESTKKEYEIGSQRKVDEDRRSDQSLNCVSTATTPTIAMGEKGLHSILLAMGGLASTGANLSSEEKGVERKVEKIEVEGGETQDDQGKNEPEKILDVVLTPTDLMVQLKTSTLPMDQVLITSTGNTSFIYQQVEESPLDFVASSTMCMRPNLVRELEGPYEKDDMEEVMNPKGEIIMVVTDMIHPDLQSTSTDTVANSKDTTADTVKNNHEAAVTGTETLVVTSTSPMMSSLGLIETDVTRTETVVVTSLTPALTITSPMVTILSHVVASSKPVVPCYSPVMTSSSPVVTSSSPVVTSSSPMVTSPSPVVTSPSSNDTAVTSKETQADKTKQTQVESNKSDLPGEHFDASQPSTPTPGRWGAWGSEAGLHCSAPTPGTTCPGVTGCWGARAEEVVERQQARLAVQREVRGIAQPDVWNSLLPSVSLVGDKCSASNSSVVTSTSPAVTSTSPVVKCLSVCAGLTTIGTTATKTANTDAVVSNEDTVETIKWKIIATTSNDIKTKQTQDERLFKSDYTNQNYLDFNQNRTVFTPKDVNSRTESDVSEQELDTENSLDRMINAVQLAHVESPLTAGVAVDWLPGSEEKLEFGEGNLDIEQLEDGRIEHVDVGRNKPSSLELSPGTGYGVMSPEKAYSVLTTPGTGNTDLTPGIGYGVRSPSVDGTPKDIPANVELDKTVKFSDLKRPVVTNLLKRFSTNSLGGAVVVRGKAKYVYWVVKQHEESFKPKNRQIYIQSEEGHTLLFIIQEDISIEKLKAFALKIWSEEGHQIKNAGG